MDEADSAEEIATRPTSPPDGEHDLELARGLVAKLQPGKPLPALLATVAPDLRPHMTWMYASRASTPGLEILTITSPDSEKVGNIQVHAGVEWLLTSRDRLEQLYLDAEAEVVEQVSEIRRLWQMIGGKDRAFFMKYYNSGLGFSIIRSRVIKATLVLPEEQRKVIFNIDDLIE